MAEIPGFIWIAVGFFIGIVSLFMGFLKPVTYNSFFQLMFFISIIMVVYGYVKIKIKEKSFNQKIEEMRYKRGEREVEIDIDDYKQRSQYGKNIGQFHNPNQKQAIMQPTHYGTSRTYNTNINSNNVNYNIDSNEHNINANMNSNEPKNNLNHYTRNFPHQTHKTHKEQNNYQIHNQQAGRHYAQMPPNFSASQNAQRICPNCKTPLLKEHKICPICNKRV